MPEPERLSDEPISPEIRRARDQIEGSSYREAESLVRQARAGDPTDPLGETLQIAVEFGRPRDRLPAQQARLLQIISEHPTLLDPRILEAQARFHQSVFRDEAAAEQAITDMEGIAARADDPGRVHLSVMAMCATAGRWRRGWPHAHEAVRLNAKLEPATRLGLYLTGRRVGHAREAWWAASQGTTPQERIGLYLRPFVGFQIWLAGALFLFGTASTSLVLPILASVLLLFLGFQFWPYSRGAWLRMLMILGALGWVVTLVLRAEGQLVPMWLVLSLLVASTARAVFRIRRRYRKDRRR